MKQSDLLSQRNFTEQKFISVNKMCIKRSMNIYVTTFAELFTEAPHANEENMDLTKYIQEFKTICICCEFPGETTLDRSVACKNTRFH